MIHMTTNGRINACILGYHLVCSETQIQQSTAICAKIGTLIFILFFFYFCFGKQVCKLQQHFFRVNVSACVTVHQPGNAQVCILPVNTNLLLICTDIPSARMHPPLNMLQYQGTLCLLFTLSTNVSYSTDMSEQFGCNQNKFRFI